MNDLSGKKYGRLSVIRQDGYHVFPSGKRKSKWLCVCDCGNVVSVVGSDLIASHTQSCGCMRRDMATNLKLSHGNSNTRLYRIWTGIKNRCYNPKQDNYAYYGGKGVTVCDEWIQSFDAFYDWAINNGYHESLTIDRIDVSGNYCPENCRWITAEEQSLNRTDNLVISFNGKSQTLKEWSKEVGIAYSCLLYRIDSGWSIDKALTTPSRNAK